MPSANPDSFNGALEAYLDRQSGQLQNAIADAIEENTALQERLGSPQRSLIELDETLNLFAGFATTYYTTILHLVSKQDHKRLSAALNKIQMEIFVLRRLVEQRSSDNLRPMLHIADHWCNTYLLSLLRPAEDATQRGGYTRRQVVDDEKQAQPVGGPQGSQISLPGAAPAIAFSEPSYRNWCLVFFESEHLIRLGRFAYNRSPTISLPLVHAYEPWHWLGLAHEIGHFVFHNTNYVPDQLPAGSSNGANTPSIEQPLAAHVRTVILRGLANHYLKAPNRNGDHMGIAHSIPLWCSWSEELFADLLGAVTLGPAYVESLATYVAARIGGEDDLLRDDGEHPMPCLRPILQILVHLQLLESEAQSRSKDERRSKDGLPDGGLDQLRNDLARIAGQWFEYCEGQFADWPKRRPPGLAKLSLSSPHGIRSRLLKWGDYVQSPVSSVPFALIVEQVGAIATTFADEVLNCVPLYDDAAFQRTRTLAGAAATVASEVEKNAKTAVLAEQSGEAAPLAPQDFVHFLAAQWHQGVRIDLATRPLRKNWLAATQRGDESIGQATHGSTVGSGRARKQESGQAGLEAAKTVIQQLLNQDNKPYAWWDRIERAWAAGKAPDEQTIEVADWLLKLSFAINAPLDCPGALAPKTVCWPGCVEPR